MTDQYEDLRKALAHYRAGRNSVVAQAMVERRISVELADALLAERDAAIEERDAALQACSDLANEMVYRGNSVAWWHSKATAYRDAIDRCWDALREAGIHPDGKTDVATAIRQLAERSNA